MSRKPPIGLEEGWTDLKESIDELIEMCETDFEGSMDVKKVMGNYSCAFACPLIRGARASWPQCPLDPLLCSRRKVYNMAVQRPPHNFCEELYTRYKDVFVQYLNHTVLPDLRAKGGQFMLAEVGKRWSNHRAMRPPPQLPRARPGGGIQHSFGRLQPPLPALCLALHAGDIMVKWMKKFFL